MNESEYLLKKVQENERTVRELEPRLMAARKRTSLYRELYELETGKQAIQQPHTAVQLEMPIQRKRRPFEKAGRLSISEAAVRMLEESKRPLHGKEILKNLVAYGAHAKNLNTLWATMSKKSKLFENLGDNKWILRKHAPAN